MQAGYLLARQAKRLGRKQYLVGLPLPDSIRETNFRGWATARNLVPRDAMDGVASLLSHRGRNPRKLRSLRRSVWDRRVHEHVSDIFNRRIKITDAQGVALESIIRRMSGTATQSVACPRRPAIPTWTRALICASPPRFQVLFDFAKGGNGGRGSLWNKRIKRTEAKL